MKKLLAIAIVLSGAANTASAETLGRLFEGTTLWDATKDPAVQSSEGQKPKVKPSKVARRKIASLPQTQKTVQTFVYSDDYSFSKNLKDVEANRSIASVPMKGRVISVRREIALTEATSKGVKQEFLINAGSRMGISKGTKLKVYRTVPVVDPFNGNKQHELKVDFATVEVVHVEEDVAVTQLVKLTEASKGSYIGLRGIIVGDFVSLN